MAQAGRLFLTAKPGVESESTAFARLALDAYFAGHQVHEAHGDRQAQAGAAKFARGGGVGLGERAKEAGLLFGRHADAGVADGEFKFDFAGVDSAAGAPIRRLRRSR